MSVIRLNKYLAQCGLGSRRACDQIIAERRVSIDGVVVESAGVRLTPGAETVLVDGKPVGVQQFVYYLLNKPKDVLCTNLDTHGRKTYLDLLPEMTTRVFPVGRLDRDSEGLLFVTNDGELANRLIHPRYEVEKVYQALCSEKLSEQALHEICRGVFSEGDHLSAESIVPIDEPNAYEIRLREGKNRHIRRMIEKTGHDVLRLKRISFGPLTIAGVKRGAYRTLTNEEVTALRQLTAEGTPAP